MQPKPNSVTCWPLGASWVAIAAGTAWAVGTALARWMIEMSVVKPPVGSISKRLVEKVWTRSAGTLRGMPLRSVKLNAAPGDTVVST